MKKNLHIVYTIIGLIFGLSFTGYAQDGETPAPYHRVSIMTELNSGTLVNDTDGVFVGNSAEFMLEYSQNFSQATWLVWYFKVSAIGNVNINNRNKNLGNLSEFPNPTWTPDWEFNGASGADLNFNYVETGLRFGDYGYIGIREDLFIKAYGFVPIKMGTMHTLTFLAGIEALPYRIGVYKISDDIEGAAAASSISAIVVGLKYDVNFHPAWKFSSEFQYRTTGEGTSGRTGNSLWEMDGMDALRYNSSFRWDNTITFATANGFSVWGQVRYFPRYFVDDGPALPQNRRGGGVQHDVYLRGGLTYNFDF